MLKTLKITAFLVAILAIGCVGALGYYAFKTDANAITLIEEEGQVEKFIASASVPKQDDTNKDSPLVKQAEKFALRIDPPPPPPPKDSPKQTTRPGQNTQPTRRTPPPSAKFTLSGTVISDNPQYSIALLDTTAKGMRWFRQGEKIGHLTIEEIGEGFVVINDGSKTYEMQSPKKERISLLKGDPDNPYSKTKTTEPEPSKTNDTLERHIQTEVIQTSVGEVAIIEKKVAPEPSPDAIKENIQFLEQIANDPESMGLSKEDAASMGDLTEFIAELNQELSDAEKRETKEKPAEPNKPKETPDKKAAVRRSRPRRTRSR